MRVMNSALRSRGSEWVMTRRCWSWKIRPWRLIILVFPGLRVLVNSQDCITKNQAAINRLAAMAGMQSLMRGLADGGTR